jgi:hypothetical protein
MSQHTHRLVAVVLVALWSWSPIGAQQPAPTETHDHGTAQGVSGPQGMMRGGPGAGMMAQMAGIHELFANHEGITRTVTNRPDGIRTVTESAVPRVAQLLKEHVASTNAQVATGDDPGLPMESDALHLIYELHDRIRTTVEETPTGVVVTQTSSDPKAVAALQQHASEVSELVKGGMAAMHAAMMKKGGR